MELELTMVAPQDLLERNIGTNKLMASSILSRCTATQLSDEGVARLTVTRSGPNPTQALELSRVHGLSAAVYTPLWTPRPFAAPPQLRVLWHGYREVVGSWVSTRKCELDLDRNKATHLS